MIVRAPHLQDDVLYDCYYAERRGEPVDPPSAEHLVDCEACARRYADVGAFLTTLSVDAENEVDALFPPERLRQQQQDIAKRLELVGRAARVITFPGRRSVAAAQPIRASRTRITTRWIAAAAAAGLFVGVAAGTFFNFVPGFDFTSHARRTGIVAGARQVSQSLPSHLSSPVKTAVEIVDPDKFMSDLESVLDRPHTSELIAFDALTPHMREVRDFAR
jgi:anti-sigma factor RsiW